MAEKLFIPLPAETAKIVLIWLECGENAAKAAKRLTGDSSLQFRRERVRNAVRKYKAWLVDRAEQRASRI